MARTNTGSTSNYITATPPAVTSPLTMACWFYPANLTATMNLLNLTDGSGIYYVLAFDGANAYGAGDNKIVAEENGSGIAASTIAVDVANTWHHACSVFASGASRAIYLDGRNKSTETTSLTALSTPVYFNIGAYYSGGSVFGPISGGIAEVGVWNVALTDAEILKLASAGAKPTDVRPDHLIIYRSLDANESLPRGGKGLSGLAMTGTMGVAAQPFPTKQNNKKHIQFIKAPAAGGGGFFARPYYELIGHHNV